MRLAAAPIVLLGSISWVLGQSASPVPVTGLTNGVDPSTGWRPARREIGDLSRNGAEQWDLYLQALSHLQMLNEAVETSYFQISGIHGLPYTPWNSVGSVPGDNNNTGYCPHNELLFATWHRPYLALFEQELVVAAINIAKRYPASSAARYQSAAQQLRIPYWDWAANASLPDAVIPQTVMVNSPNGVVTIFNPLYRYLYTSPPETQMDGAVNDTRPFTLRCAGPEDSWNNNATASNQGWYGDPGMIKDGKSLTRGVYDTFIREHTFGGMACGNCNGTSFESPHNGVHNTVGCSNGTMEDLRQSAFDPIFWLHHTNVDRLIAMWQAIHYENSVLNSSAVSQDGLFGMAKGTIMNATTPLKPFFKADGTFHDSLSVADIKTFGYTYPEIVDWVFNSSQDLAANVTLAVNQLYSWGDRQAGNESGTWKRSSPGARGSGKYYTAEFEVDRAELDLPCSIHLVAQGRELAKWTLLGMPASGVSRASIVLEDFAAAVGLPDASVDLVIPFLRRNMQVKIVQRDGSATLSSSVPSLKVKVQNLDYVERASDSEFPSFGKATRWNMILRNAD